MKNMHLALDLVGWILAAAVFILIVGILSDSPLGTTIACLTNQATGFSTNACFFPNGN